MRLETSSRKLQSNNHNPGLSAAAFLATDTKSTLPVAPDFLCKQGSASKILGEKQVSITCDREIHTAKAFNLIFRELIIDILFPSARVSCYEHLR